MLCILSANIWFSYIHDNDKLASYAMQEIEILASDIYKQVKIVVKTNSYSYIALGERI